MILHLLESFPTTCRDAMNRVCSSRLKPLRIACILLGLLALLSTSGSWPGAQQTSQPDPRLKAFHVLSARIIMTDTQAEVDGSLQNTSRSDRFPYDVTVIATFYN